MDEIVVKYYRRILKAGFPYAGSLKDPSILLDAVGENVRICDHVGTDTLQIFIKITDGLVTEVRYLCMCDPTTNVAVEIFCRLAVGGTLDSLKDLSVESFLGALGAESQDLAKKAKGLMELVNKGVRRYVAVGASTDNVDTRRGEDGQ
jgi:hypothetical protein